MNWNEISEWVLILGVSFGAGTLTVSHVKANRRVRELESRWNAFMEHREQLYASMADANSIETQMEKGARLREMKDAQRTTLPRDDAVGQHAVVYRPRLRSKLPNKFRSEAPINRPEQVAKPEQND